MEEIFLFAVALFVLSSLVLSWINRKRISDLRKDVRRLKDEAKLYKSQLNDILDRLEGEGERPPHVPADVVVSATDNTRTQTHKNTSFVSSYVPQSGPIIPDDVVQETGMFAPEGNFSSESLPAIDVKSAKIPHRDAVSFEQQFGARLPVWIGAVALALAGFFMVKYSIETGLLSPSVRVLLGGFFGLGLLFAANWVRGRQNFANGTRIAQALSGAGIADLYICLFAATSLYDLIPDFLGFSGMAATTATAVILSLRHGMPIALLGLLGGFLTPVMVAAQEPQAPVLFIYLYFVVTGLMVVARREAWWQMALPVVLGAFLWVCIWLFGNHYNPHDSICLGLFIMAVSATVVAMSKDYYDLQTVEGAGLLNTSSLLNYATLAGAILFMGIITAQAGFGFIEWGLFGLISLGSIGLAFFNQRLYGLVPWGAMAANLVMLLFWQGADKNILALTISLFALLYIASGYVLQYRSEKPMVWALLAALACISYYLLGYYKVRHASIPEAIPLFWGGLALLGAGLGIIEIQKIIKNVPASYSQRHLLLAIYAATSTAFLSIALTVELPRPFLPVAFAGQLCAVAWINIRLPVKAFRVIVGALAVVFGLLLLPQIILLLQIGSYSLVGAKLMLQKTLPIIETPSFQLGLPGVFFALASYFLRIQKDDRLVAAFEVAAVALIGVMGYYLSRYAFADDVSEIFVKASFVERGVISNIMFVYGVFCLWTGKYYMRPALIKTGIFISLFVVFRIVYFDMIFDNPIWSRNNVGSFPLFNGLMVNYGLPIVWTLLALRVLTHLQRTDWHKYGYCFVLLLVFTLLSMNVRQIFHGAYLDGHETTNAEIYSYSVVWLLLGIGLLFWGTLKNDRMIRIASLAIMILTVGKVFLYDASELHGLFRVFSFFGLGLSLLGLSWFYTRFVFGGPNPR